MKLFHFFPAAISGICALALVSCGALFPALSDSFPSENDYFEDDAVIYNSDSSFLVSDVIGPAAVVATDSETHFITVNFTNGLVDADSVEKHISVHVIADADSPWEKYLETAEISYSFEIFEVAPASQLRIHLNADELQELALDPTGPDLQIQIYIDSSLTANGGTRLFDQDEDGLGSEQEDSFITYVALADNTGAPYDTPSGAPSLPRGYFELKGAFRNDDVNYENEGTPEPFGGKESFNGSEIPASFYYYTLPRNTGTIGTADPADLGLLLEAFNNIAALSNANYTLEQMIDRQWSAVATEITRAADSVYKVTPAEALQNGSFYRWRIKRNWQSTTWNQYPLRVFFADGINTYHRQHENTEFISDLLLINKLWVSETDGTTTAPSVYPNPSPQIIAAIRNQYKDYLDIDFGAAMAADSVSAKHFSLIYDGRSLPIDDIYPLPDSGNQVFRLVKETSPVDIANSVDLRIYTGMQVDTSGSSVTPEVQFFVPTDLEDNYQPYMTIADIYVYDDNIEYSDGESWTSPYNALNRGSISEVNSSYLFKSAPSDDYLLASDHTPTYYLKRETTLEISLTHESGTLSLRYLADKVISPEPDAGSILYQYDSATDTVEKTESVTIPAGTIFISGAGTAGATYTKGFIRVQPTEIDL